MQFDRRLRSSYLRLVSTRAFAPTLSAAFLLAAIAQIITIVALVTGRSGGYSSSDRHIPLLDSELAAVGGLLGHFLIYIALRVLISHEEELA